MTKDRITFIDTAKGVGILLVVLFHIDYLPKIPYFNEWGGVILVFYMPFFFLLSGIFFSGKNLRKRAMRLLKPFAFFFIAAFGIKALLSLLGHHLIEWNQFLEPILGNCPYRVNPPLWFLQALLMQTLLGVAIIKIPNKVVTFVVSLAISILGYIIGTIYNINDYYISSALIAFPFFIAGKLFRSELLTTRSPWVYVITMLIAILMYAFTCAENVVNASLAHITCGWFPFMVIASSTSYSLLGFCKYLDRVKYVGSIMRFYGVNSLTVLCTHMIILFIPYLVTRYIPFDIVSIIFIFIFIVISEIPIIKFINKYLYRIIVN